MNKHETPNIERKPGQLWRIIDNEDTTFGTMYVLVQKIHRIDSWVVLYEGELCEWMESFMTYDELINDAEV